MHDAIQWGTLILVGFGIMLSRYDAGAIRKEMREDNTQLRKEMSDLRGEVHRSTTMLTELLVEHAQRITKIETKMEGKP